MNNYIFCTTRLGFRTWRQSDINVLNVLNNDEEVMACFPKKSTLEDTLNFIRRMQYIFFQKSYCYFAVDTLVDGDFIGFIGLSDKAFPSDFTPCVDIGWRLKRAVWNQGLATEGAKACLAYGFEKRGLAQINAIAPAQNIQSQRVMEKAGMQKRKYFDHPELEKHKNLQKCVLYSITAKDYGHLSADQKVQMFYS